eukprot:g3000.t1
MFLASLSFFVGVTLLMMTPPSQASTLSSPIVKGYYSWNWGKGSSGPSSVNPGDVEIGVAFTGLIDVENAIKAYTPGASWCCPELKGETFLSLGGGNAAGQFTKSALESIQANLNLVKKANYSGIILDVEEVSGSASDLIPLFQSIFKNAKALQLRTAVTTSHSAPYQCDSSDDAIALVKAWVADKNLDIISPQLYSSGSESSPEFATTASCTPGCGWNLYETFQGIFAPSIVDPSQYSATVEYFQSHPNNGINVGGYFMWKQV